jgi:predicted dehydrogenase
VRFPSTPIEQAKLMRLGFIGFGIMGERLLRAALAHDPDVWTVSGAFDPHPTTANRLQSIDPRITFYATAAEVVAASDCLHIASPPASHLDYLAMCHAAGKAVLCEKPLAIDVNAATAAVSLLPSMRAAVNFLFASSYAVDQIEAAVRDGFVGTPQRLDIVVEFQSWPRLWQQDAESWLDRRAEGGFVREVLSHFLFLSRRLLGPLQLRSADVAFPQDGCSERHVTADLTAGGVQVTIRGSVGATSHADHNLWSLTGSDGTVRLRDWSIAERQIGGQWLAQGDTISNERMRPLVLARQLDKVAALTRGEQTNLATLDEALQVQTIVEQILVTGCKGAG